VPRETSRIKAAKALLRRHPIITSCVLGAVVLAALVAVLLIALNASTATVAAVMLALVAAYIGAAQVWIAVSVGQAQIGLAGAQIRLTDAAVTAERDQEQKREKNRIDRFERLMFEATYEAAHNLQHLAALTGGGVLDRSKPGSTA
jgi:cell division protein FtsW (lipid II flippase)